MSVDEKLDHIISIIEKDRATKSKNFKEELVAFMLKNHNIKWLDDAIEEDIYEVMLTGIQIIFEKFL